MGYLTLKEFNDKTETVKISTLSHDEITDLGRYDWFEEDELHGYTKRIQALLSQITKESLQNHEVFFKEGCPASDSQNYIMLYIRNRETDASYCIGIDDTRNGYRYSVDHSINDYEEPLFQTNHLDGIIDYFNGDQMEKDLNKYLELEVEILNMIDNAETIGRKALQKMVEKFVRTNCKIS